MTEIVKRRRRWPWVVLAAMLIVCGGPVAWRFRPLSAEERSVIGIWRCRVPRAPSTFTITFTDDRRYLLLRGNHQSEEEGQWSISGDRLTCSAEIPGLLAHRFDEYVGDILNGVSRRRQWLVAFETADRMRVTETPDPRRITEDTSQSEIYHRIPASEAENFSFFP